MSDFRKSAGAIFDAALELTPELRAAFLDKACEDDPATRKRVESLLGAHEAAGKFMQGPAQPVLTTAVHTLKDQSGEKLGRYKLLQQIGEGGCGVVYMAEQEEPVRRRVALKVIKLGMDTKNVIARFEVERQALAMMEHPNIAKVLDAGATDTGRPYFVMELVRGTKITDYCDQNNLAMEDRLGLFMRVCHAIQHAHQKGVIHRDIKPSNILVTLHDGVPVPKVIDFGIAKATQGRLTDQTLFTAFEQFVGTPAYMSPEQAEMTGLDVDTRADIYALGVLLYELLTGRTPFEGKALLAGGLDAMRRTIREQEPVRPSTRLSTLAAAELRTVARCQQTEPPKLIHLVRGDLDWIVMRCLEKDRARRYETANGVAMDIQRHLNNEPITARPPSDFYRLQKLVLRHQPAFIAGGAVTAALIVGLCGALWQWRRAERHAQGESRQRQLTEEHAARTRLNLYAADVSMASQAMERGDYGLARRTLAALRPTGGEKDLRGFEWRYLWNLCRGDQLTTLGTHEWIVTCAAFSPDGTWIATGSQDGTAKVWSSARRQLITTLSGLEGVWSIAFSPDGKTLMAAGAMGVHLWDTGSWKLSGTFPGKIAALSKSGSVLAIADSSPFAWEPAGKISLWDYASKKKLRELDKPGRALAFSPDGQTLAVAGPDKGVELWDPTSGQLRRTLPTQDTVWGLNFSPDGNQLAVVGWENKPAVWNLRTEEPPNFLKNTYLNYWSAIFSPDGSTLITTGSDQTIRLWDAATLQAKGTLRGHDSEVWCAALSPDGALLVTGGKDQNVMLWPVKPRARREQLPNRNRTIPVFSPDGARIVTSVYADSQPWVTLWNVADGAPITRLPRDEMVGFSADGAQLISWARNATAIEQLSLQPPATNHLALKGLGPDTGNFWPCGVSPERDILFAIDSSGVVRFWNLASGVLLGVLQGPAPPIRAAVLAPRAKHLALSLEREKVIRLIDRATGRELQLAGHRDFASGLAFSPDGAVLATGSVDGTIRLWDTATGAQLAILPGHMQETTDVAFSPDGNLLASMGQRESIKFWHLPTQREVVSLDFPHAGMSLQFSPDGRRLAVTTDQNTLQFFEAPTLEELDRLDRARDQVELPRK